MCNSEKGFYIQKLGLQAPSMIIEQQNEGNKYSRYAKMLFAGGIAGCCAKTFVAPLDRIKILLQAHNRHYKHLGILSTLKHVIDREGFFSLYKSNFAQMIRIFPYSAIQFGTFEFCKKNLPGKIDHPHFLKLTAGSIAGSTGGLHHASAAAIMYCMTHDISFLHYVGAKEAIRISTNKSRFKAIE
ncbi:graves disease carrier protein homolog [Lingula anatina]|uniref:Graves disease carrier protein homolog n=1 Tax=Lingula anatina TaxID=7574 RepID=A0A1S3JXM5_LINAN|nr:graves disease carrier protein homolog [Lingula anatina]|eukprot:XP_013415062.1 graves disease carrier protein homolog [Lingula anatina]